VLTARDSALRHRLVAVDALTAVATLTVTWLALVGRAEASPSLTPAGVPATLVALAGGWIAAVVTSGLYDHRRAWSIQRDGQALIQAAVLTMVCGFALGTVVGAPPAILLAIIGVPPLLACAGLAARMGMKAFGERNRGAGATRYILVVGLGDAAREFATRIDERWWLRLEILGFLGDATEGERLPEATYLGTVDDLTRILHERIVDDVAVCLQPGDASIGWVVTTARDEGKTIHMPVGVGPLDRAAASVEDLGGLTLVTVGVGPNQTLAMHVKRYVDIVGAIVGLVVLSPILVVAAVAILLTDGRPVLFRQQRAGLNGRPFRIVKFRTMTRDADSQRDALRASNEISGSASFKLTEDPRVTRVGRVLRKTSIDELPQLWNVLKGEMSLVGPRPHPFDDVAGYAPWHRRRLSVKPGITGLWQVKGRLDPTFDHWVQLDLEYIDHWSIWLDFRLLLKTVPALLRAEGR
jgi:exopolysaccharide biosynthesis polyprenyl glycosylphosphotransferase